MNIATETIAVILTGVLLSLSPLAIKATEKPQPTATLNWNPTSTR